MENCYTCQSRLQLFLTFPIISYLITALIAHNGFKFDFPILFNEITRRQPAISLDMLRGIYFADSLEYLRQVHSFIHPLETDMHNIHQMLRCLILLSDKLFINQPAKQTISLNIKNQFLRLPCTVPSGVSQV